MRQLADRLSIRTPEGIEFTLPLAGPAARFLAWGIDVGVIVVSYMALVRLLYAMGVIFPGFYQAVLVISLLVMQFAYRTLMEWLWRGRTIGKWLLGLEVMDEGGLRLRFSQVAMRNLVRAADALPGLYLVGGLTMLLSTRRQRLGDIAGNTMVVRVTRPRQPDMEQLLGERHNSLREHPHLCARLRQSVDNDLTRIAVQAILRREELDPEARIHLFDDIAGAFKEVVRFPDEITSALTGEQYVRNVVDVLFRESARG